MIKIIDYGLGNVQAFLNIYERLHISAKVAQSVGDLDDATRLILPGVGHFDYAMQMLTKSGMKSEIESLVMGDSIPMLGVCVGMQIMADYSEEGDEKGLGWISGSVKRLDEIAQEKCDLPLPHMGWNSVTSDNKDLFYDIDLLKFDFYFLHTYYFDCSFRENCIANTYYGSDFCSAVKNKNIFGVQFHPEKSHHSGVQLLKNFANLEIC